jgi:hypothetical protein
MNFVIFKITNILPRGSWLMSIFKTSFLVMAWWGEMRECTGVCTQLPRGMTFKTCLNHHLQNYHFSFHYIMSKENNIILPICINNYLIFQNTMRKDKSFKNKKLKNSIPFIKTRKKRKKRKTFLTGSFLLSKVLKILRCFSI